jgi:hypothetical protein
VIAVSMQGQAISVVQAQRGFWNFYWLNPPTVDSSHLVEVVAPKKVPDRLGTCWKLWPSRWRLWVDDVLYQVEEEGLRVLERTRGGTELGTSSLLATDRGEVINAFNQSLHTFTQPWPERVCLAPRYPLQVSAVGQALAALLSDGTWRLCWLESSVDLDIAGEVLGLVRVSQAGLAILVRENGRLWLQGPDGRDVVELGDKLESAVLHPKGLLAYRTRSGDAGVYSFEDGCRRWVSTP